MTRFVYDGSFDGFLCAASRALGEEATIASISDLPTDLFTRDVSVVTEDPPARDLEKRFVAAAGKGELETLLLVHASARKEAPTLLLRYIRLTLQAGASAAGDISRPEVLSVIRIRDRVSREINRLLGFIRFRKIAGGLYYSSIEPDSDIVGFLGPHFADRFSDQSFLIHDLARGIGFWHDCGARGRRSQGLADLREMPQGLANALRRDAEPNVESLWREYFKTIAINERSNPMLQEKLMPRRYWAHIVEMGQLGERQRIK